MSVEIAMKTVGFNVRGDRQKDDYYATPPEATDALLSVESFEGNIFEPCCGEGHISKRLIERGYTVESSDLVDRGYGIPKRDFLFEREKRDNIITNPPYAKMSLLMAEHAQSIARYKTALLLKITFLEGVAISDYLLFLLYLCCAFFFLVSSISLYKFGILLYLIIKIYLIVVNYLNHYCNTS